MSSDQGEENNLESHEENNFFEAGDEEYYEEADEDHVDVEENNGGDVLQQFLVDNNLQEHLPLLQEQQIDFETLMMLTEQDLKSLQLPLGPYRKLVNALAKKKSTVETKDKLAETGDDSKQLCHNDGSISEGNFTIVDESGDESDAHSTKSDDRATLTEKKKSDDPEPAKLLQHHPYYYDLLDFQLGGEFKEKLELSEPGPLDKTPFEFVQDERKLRHVIRALRKEKIIAVDYKFSDAKYKKQMQLMQLSTPGHDYLIDLAKNQQLLILLTDVFVNPNIQKVFFDGRLAVRQLQTAWKLFFVNVFCVKSAAKILGSDTYQQSLYALLNKYGTYFRTTHSEACQRPLKNEVRNNLRKETHHLLDIYSKIRNEAIDANKLDEITQACLGMTRYLSFDMIPGPQGVFNDYDKFNASQKQACDQLYEWRDSIALQRDLNPNLVLHKKFFRTLVLSLPTKKEEILSIANVPIVKLYILKIMGILKDARKRFQKEPVDASKYNLSEVPPIKQKKKKEALPMKRKNDDFTHPGSNLLQKRGKYYGNKKPIKKFGDKKPLNPPRGYHANKLGSKPKSSQSWFMGQPKFASTPRNVWDSGHNMNQQHNNYNTNYSGGGFKYF